MLDNTLRFAAGLPANNAMLWGARGMGKSSLVKAAHAAANAAHPGSLALIEIHREDIRTLPDLLNLLRGQPRHCLILCDDLSFEKEDADYKALKSVLDGGIEGRPANVLFYATSNRPPPHAPRHDRQRAQQRHQSRRSRRGKKSPSPTASASGSASTTATRDAFFAMVDGYADELALPIARDALHTQANEWSVTRGSRSGRVAWQFIQDLAGRLGDTREAAE